MNLLKKIYQINMESPEKEALIFSDTMYTYRELWEKALSLASGLREMGLIEGGRVLLVLSNCPEFVIAYYGIIAAGGIVVPVNPTYTSKEMGFILADADPFAIITNPDLAPVVKAALSERKMSLRPLILVGNSKKGEESDISFDNLLESGPLKDLDLDQDSEKVIELLYTSGTTGAPKGAMLTHRNLYSNTETFAIETEMSPADRALLVAPAYHAAAQTCVMNNALFAGGTLVIQQGWQGAAAVLESFQKDKINFFFGPPTMYTFIVNEPDFKQYDVSSLRLAFTGAASLPAEIFKRFKELFGFEIMEGYGLSETSPVNTTNPYRGLKKTGSIGKAISGVDVKIFNEKDEELPLGEIGEIVVKGPNVMKGYFNNEEDTAYVMRGGWFHTGDLAYMDDDGYVFIVDRKKDLIIRGGMNVFPREVEEAIYTHPDVLEVAVIGVEDEVMGEEAKAFIVPKENVELDIENVKEHCRKSLAKYKIPKYFKTLQQLPKTTTGKILKRELRGKEFQ